MKRITLGWLSFFKICGIRSQILHDIWLPATTEAMEPLKIHLSSTYQALFPE